MAIAKIGCQLDTSREKMTHVQINKWMLPREKLEIIARHLLIVKGLPHVVREENLPDLPEMQKSCFSSLKFGLDHHSVNFSMRMLIVRKRESLREAA